MSQESPHRHTVLLVDDDADLLEATRLLLENHGYGVMPAISGARALGMLASGARPCLILLDMWMPEMDGWEVWNRIRATPAWAEIPVVALSASAEIVRAHEEGVAGALAKPVESGELTTTVERYVQCPGCAPSARRPGTARMHWDPEPGTVRVRD